MPGGDFELPEGTRRSGMPQTDLSAHKKTLGRCQLPVRAAFVPVADPGML